MELKKVVSISVMIWLSITYSCAQTDTSKKLCVTLIDGSEIVGRIVGHDSSKLIFHTSSGVQIEIEKNSIKGVQLISAADDSTDLYWFNIGAGISSTDLSVGASLSYDLGGSFISIRYVNNSEFTFLGPTPSENVLDLGVLYGKRVKTSYGLASISAGVAVVNGVRRGKYLKNGEGWMSSKEYEPITFTTIGVPVEWQLFWEPTSLVGIGLYGFADLNPQSSFVGVLICFQFGNLK